ncbi:MAG TPA: dihydrofolate reductase [Agromyces sp.]|nr:dihydrofolate reductase [Agromyces sp.]
MTRADAAGPAIGLIWAEAEGRVIGRDGGMPWHVPEDLAHFKAVTLGAPVVMGRKTWESLPPRFRPLPGRRNIVVTRQAGWSAQGADVAASVDDALALAASAAVASAAVAPAVVGDPDGRGWVWVIGGAELFDATIARADRLEVTELRHDAEAFAAASGDALAPAIDPARFAISAVDPAGGWHTSRSGIRYRFLTYTRA